MIDFATLKGLTVPEGVVMKISIDGVEVWNATKFIALQVKKENTQTYYNSTDWDNQSFIVLDIYPKSGGTVNVTYGGLTKTITDDGVSEEPAAQQVFFGRFKNQQDDVETPESGILTIDGDYRAFGCSSFNETKTVTAYYTGIVSIIDFGSVQFIPDFAINYAASISVTDPIVNPLENMPAIPEGVTSIGRSAFYNFALTNAIIPSSVTSIGDYAFYPPSGNFSTPTVIIILSNTPPVIGSSLFGSTTDTLGAKVPLTIKVPIGCGEAYKTAEGWSVYADFIVEGIA